MKRKPQTTVEAMDELQRTARALWSNVRASNLPVLLLGVWIGMAVMLVVALLAGA